MKVFISWSGDLSRKVAELLQDWIKCVLQASRPWLSTHDIDSGSLWLLEISNQLQDTTVGIICLTKANRNKPWILFEAGALAKGLNTSRVCPLLIDLTAIEVEPPISQFNLTMPDENGVRKLMRSLNQQLGDQRLEDETFDKVFKTYWPQFQTSFDELIKQTKEDYQEPDRGEQSILEELLTITRSLQARMGKLESDLGTKALIIQKPVSPLSSAQVSVPVDIKKLADQFSIFAKRDGEQS